MRAVLFLGTGSGVGKTTLDAVYCRYLVKKGYKVAPFKASNLSLNSFVTDDGKEIGVGQALQAWACGLKPESDMNPVLLKPSGHGKIQMMLKGELFIGNRAAMAKICESYDDLVSRFDRVVCEGSGSPAELNLQDRDLANVGMMRARRMPAVLVGNIERGGVFAAIYGTWLLMPKDVRPLLKAFIINRFRGDASILKGGIERIEELTGMKCVGVVPYESLCLPEEDSVSQGSGDIREFVRNLDKLLESAQAAGVDFSIIDDLSA